MKVLSCTIAFLIILTECIGQDTFYHVLEDIRSEEFSGVCEFDGKYCCVGYQKVTNSGGVNDRDGLIHLFDDEGNTIQKITINNFFSEQYSEVLKGNNSLFAIGTKLDQGNVRKQKIITQLNFQGQIVNTIPFGDTSRYFGDLRIDGALRNDVGIMIFGNAPNNDISGGDGNITLLSEFGDVVWSRLFNRSTTSNDLDYFSSLATDPTGMIGLLHTETFGSIYPTGEQTIIKMDEVGNELWRIDCNSLTSVFPNLPMNTGIKYQRITAIKNGYLLLGQAIDEFNAVKRSFFIKLDSDGNEHESTIQLDSLNYQVSDFQYLPDGTILLYGMDLFQLPNDPSPKHLIVKWNKNQELEWSSRIGEPNGINWQMKGLGTKDGGHITVGSIFRTNQGISNFDPIVSKTDCTGDLAWNFEHCSINQSDASVIVFPNPSNDIFYCHFNEEMNGAIYVFDEVGRKILTSSLSQARIVKIDLSNQSSGFYFYRFEVENDQVLKGKLILY